VRTSQDTWRDEKLKYASAASPFGASCVTSRSHCSKNVVASGVNHGSSCGGNDRREANASGSRLHQYRGLCSGGTLAYANARAIRTYSCCRIPCPCDKCDRLPQKPIRWQKQNERHALENHKSILPGPELRPALAITRWLPFIDRRQGKRAWNENAEARHRESSEHRNAGG